jgi:hypothetical protein
MDRDAHTASSNSDPAEVVPPFEPSAVRKVGGAAVVVLAAAAALGLVATGTEVPSLVHTVRLVLVFVGSIAAGAAVSMRPDRWQSWALGAASAGLAVIGTPAHWDSFRILFGALAGVSLAWAVVLAAPERFRLPVLSAVILFHFLGIFFATTTPPATPWLTEQAFIRIYNPYLQFVYLRNAYHFYSPQPGPACVLAFFLKTETGTDPNTGEKRYETRWVVVPKRPADVKDPLGLTYYRRLSLTEQVARGTAGLQTNSFEKLELLPRRVQMPIPLHPIDDQNSQYQLPQPEIARYVLPSYASHVILENTADAKTAAKTTVKVYRLQHNTMSVEEFINWPKPEAPLSPYHPTTYRPYFLGEFDARGALVNPQEPMLYWLVPVLPRRGGAAPGDPNHRDYVDYLSFHALYPEWIGPDKTPDDLSDPKYKDRLFEWSQLR